MSNKTEILDTKRKLVHWFVVFSLSLSILSAIFYGHFIYTKDSFFGLLPILMAIVSILVLPVVYGLIKRKKWGFWIASVILLLQTPAFFVGGSIVDLMLGISFVLLIYNKRIYTK